VGDPAGGSARQGRDPRIQAILPIRGKILNVEKARIDKVLANTEVQAIISALGTGIHEEFSLEKLRYHKIVLMADADVDGHHINTLLLTLLFRFMKPLIEHGYVYMAQPPLYRLRWNKPAEHEFVYSDSERDALMRDGLEQGKKLPKENPVQRYKGLGEMNADELWETTMDPERRILLQVTLDDALQADETFAALKVERVKLERLLRESDIVSVHVPLTDKTRHLVGAAELELMKSGAIVVNTSRGGVVDQREVTRRCPRRPSPWTW